MAEFKPAELCATGPWSISITWNSEKSILNDKTFVVKDCNGQEIVRIGTVETFDAQEKPQDLFVSFFKPYRSPEEPATQEAMTQIFSGSPRSTLQKLIQAADAANYINARHLPFADDQSRRKDFIDNFTVNEDAGARALAQAMGLTLPAPDSKTAQIVQRVLLPPEWKSAHENLKIPETVHPLEAIEYLMDVVRKNEKGARLPNQPYKPIDVSGILHSSRELALAKIDMKGPWSIKVASLDLFHPWLSQPIVHNYIQVADSKGQIVVELQGLGTNRKTGSARGLGDSQDCLRARALLGKTFFDRVAGSERIFSGSPQQVMEKIIRAYDAMNFINAQNLNYDRYELFEEAGGQNSNSVAHTLVVAMGLKFPEKTLSYWVPGHERILLPENWRSKHENVNLPQEKILPALAAMQARTDTLVDDRRYSFLGYNGFYENEPRHKVDNPLSTSPRKDNGGSALFDRRKPFVSYKPADLDPIINAPAMDLNGIRAETALAKGVKPSAGAPGLQAKP